MVWVDTTTVLAHVVKHQTLGDLSTKQLPYQTVGQIAIPTIVVDATITTVSSAASPYPAITFTFNLLP
jgi:hypothetical protein